MTFIYVFAVWLSFALAFQRVAYSAAIPQLVPKRFLGYANGVLQLGNGAARLVMPMVAAGLLAVIDMDGIILIDMASYAFAVGVLAVVRFPDAMGFRRYEPLLTEIANGFRYSWHGSGLRVLLVYSALINLFLGPLLVLNAPLVLSFASLGDVGIISSIDAAGVLLGGLVLSVWGGPRHRRVWGFAASAVAMAVFAGVTGLRPSLPLVAVGIFGAGLAMSIHQGIGTTIIQVKVPQRYHGRVFAINQMLAWSTLPIGFGVIAPIGANVFGPMLEPGGALASTVGAVIGTGPGRGIALMYPLFALGMLVVTAVALANRSFAGFDEAVPDALPDDLVGAAEHAERAGTVTAVVEPVG